MLFRSYFYMLSIVYRLIAVLESNAKLIKYAEYYKSVMHDSNLVENVVNCPSLESPTGGSTEENSHEYGVKSTEEKCGVKSTEEKCEETINTCSSDDPINNIFPTFLELRNTYGWDKIKGKLCTLRDGKYNDTRCIIGKSCGTVIHVNKIDPENTGILLGQFLISVKRKVEVEW